jgi:DNA-binding transcriptional LysR family regulator
VPIVLERFGQACPGFEMRLVERQLFAALDIAFDSGQTSLMIRSTTPQSFCRKPFQFLLLWREPICLVVHAEHSLATRDFATEIDTGEQPRAIGGRSAQDAEITTLLSGADVRPRSRAVSSQPQSIVVLARHQLAIGVINTLAGREAKLDDVALVPLENSIVRRVGL